jgi:hypothetical protein
MCVDVSGNATDDLTFDAEQLRTKYHVQAADGEWGEHPNYPMKEWRAEVDGKRTRVGYWDWVVTKLRPAVNEGDKSHVLAAAEKKEYEELETEDPGNQGY